MDRQKLTGEKVCHCARVWHKRAQWEGDHLLIPLQGHGSLADLVYCLTFWHLICSPHSSRTLWI